MNNQETRQSAKTANITDHLDTERILTWWDRQAKSNPDSAGILPTHNEQFIGLLYRQEAEWLHFRSILPLDGKMGVLELGCGAGRWSLRIAPLVGRVVGIDFSENMIQLARNKHQSSALKNLEFLVSAAPEVILNDRFDIIYLSGITSYLTDEQLRQTLNNARKMLNPGGTLVERTSVSLQSRELFDDGGYQSIYRTIQEEIALFSEFGFHLIYRAPSYARMHLPRLLIMNDWFQILTKAGFRYFPKTTTLLFRFGTRLWKIIKPGKHNSEKRSHDFLIFKINTLRDFCENH